MALNCIVAVGMALAAAQIHYALTCTVPVGIENHMIELVVRLQQGIFEAEQGKVLEAGRAVLYMGC